MSPVNSRAMADRWLPLCRFRTTPATIGGTQAPGEPTGLGLTDWYRPRRRGAQYRGRSTRPDAGRLRLAWSVIAVWEGDGRTTAGHTKQKTPHSQAEGYGG